MTKASTKNGTTPMSPLATAVAPTESLLRQVLESNLMVANALNRMATALERERNASPWVSALEAASLLGFDTSKKNYARKLSWLIRNGWIQKYQDGRPRRYYREELVKISRKMATGEIAFVGQV